MKITLFITAVLTAFIAGCVTNSHDLTQIHYGLTKTEIVKRIGKPNEKRYIIQNDRMVQAVLRQCNLAGAGNCRFRTAKTGDRVNECLWVVEKKFLLVVFLNDGANPALIWFVESNAQAKATMQ